MMARYMNKKRFIAQSQGTLKIIWNVLDTKLSIYKEFCLAGKNAKQKAIKEAQRLNKDRRYKRIDVTNNGN